MEAKKAEIVWCNVSMEQAFGVQVTYGVTHLSSQQHNLGFFQAPVHEEQGLKITAFQQHHAEIRLHIIMHAVAAHHAGVGTKLELTGLPKPLLGSDTQTSLRCTGHSAQ